MKVLSVLAGLAMLLMFAWFGLGCSNPDNVTKPDLPEPGNDNSDQRDPNIHVPYSEFESYAVRDFAFEKDGDLVISDEGRGLLLFDIFGQLKRPGPGDPGYNPPDDYGTWVGGLWEGLIDMGPGWLDSGRGVIASGTATMCLWQSFYDDQNVSGGTNFPTAAQWWWDGEAHPPPTCNPVCSSGDFDCDTVSPLGIDLHPIVGWLFIKIDHPKVQTDPDCQLDPDKIPDFMDMSPGIMAISPNAPGMDGYYDGEADYVVYHNKSDKDIIDLYGYPMASSVVKIFNWDPSNPFTMIPPRDGIGTPQVNDFEFDAYGRMVCTLPSGNAFAITNPVNPPDMIVVQRIIGGANDGTSHKPGDFYGPRGVAIDPRNQEIYITDTGLNRVQVFDNQGKFIRMFGTGVASAGLDISSPGAIEVDSFGNVYIAVANSPGFIVVNEYGQPVSYGSIEGIVRDKKTGVVLDNVIVSISSTYREYLDVTETDGKFYFQTVPQGDHTLVANRPGYKAGSADVFVTGGQKTTVTLYLERSGVGQSGYGGVTGKTMSSIDGDPLGGLLVTIKGLGITDTTTSEGTFHLIGVPEGDHVMQILSGSIVIYETDVHVNSDIDTPLGWIYLPL